MKSKFILSVFSILMTTFSCSASQATQKQRASKKGSHARLLSSVFETQQSKPVNTKHAPKDHVHIAIQERLNQHNNEDPRLVPLIRHYLCTNTFPIKANDLDESATTRNIYLVVDMVIDTQRRFRKIHERLLHNKISEPLLSEYKNTIEKELQDSLPFNGKETPTEAISARVDEFVVDRQWRATVADLSKFAREYRSENYNPTTNPKS